MFLGTLPVFQRAVLRVRQEGRGSGRNGLAALRRCKPRAFARPETAPFPMETLKGKGILHPPLKAHPGFSVGRPPPVTGPIPCAWPFGLCGVPPSPLKVPPPRTPRRFSARPSPFPCGMETSPCARRFSRRRRRISTLIRDVPVCAVVFPQIRMMTRTAGRCPVRAVVFPSSKVSLSRQRCPHMRGGFPLPAKPIAKGLRPISFARRFSGKGASIPSGIGPISFARRFS